MDLESDADDVSRRIIALADQCVQCGLCLPHCPTYAVSAEEGASPRGRIALARALADGSLEPAARALDHLDHCLACMACERVCPSHVRYGELLGATRAALSRRGHATGGRTRWLAALLARPRWLGALLRVANMPVLRTVARSPAMRALGRRIPLARALAELPWLPPRPASVAPSGATRGRVGLLSGCLAASVDRDVHAAARRVLQALGYAVTTPTRQGCCGALAVHRGEQQQASRMATALRAAFRDTGVDTVLASASGCFGTLRDAVFAGTAMRVREIHDFIAGDAALARLRFRALAETVVLHMPCTQRNVAQGDAAIRQLLARVPELRIVELPVGSGCCGAAGDHFLRHPCAADALRDATLAPLADSGARVLLTSNVGCRAFLDNGLRHAGAGVRVIHPVVLLAEQLED